MQVNINNLDKISVFIVDDSALVRSALSIILNKAPDIELIGAAANPKLALTKMKKQWPDVIICDLEMPEMSGLEFLDYLNKNHPTPFIVCSSYAGVGAQASIDALALGAVDIISKPNIGVESYLEEITTTIIESIKGAASCRVQLRSTPAEVVFETAPKIKAVAAPAIIHNRETNRRLDFKPCSVIAIGSSTGGTTVIEHLLRRLSPSCPPVVIVQHMPMHFTEAFARRLNTLCAITVKEAEDGDILQQGMAFIAPGGKHMELVKSKQGLAIRIFDALPVNRHKPSVDTLLVSVADLVAESAVGVILTGMGKDGSQGLLQMKQKGAFTVAQDQITSAVYGMPKVAVDIGATDVSLTITEIGSYLEKLGTRADNH